MNYEGYAAMCELCKLIAEMETIDLNQMAIIPDGANQPLPQITESDYMLTPGDVRRAIRKWDEIMPRFYRGILEAKTIGEETA